MVLSESIAKYITGMALAGFALNGCQIQQRTQITSGQIEKSVDDVVKDAIKQFSEGKTQEAQELLEAYKTQKKDFSASAHCLLALAYSANLNIKAILAGDEHARRIPKEIEKEFEELEGRFKEDPLILIEIQAQLGEFFKTKKYEELERTLRGFLSLEKKLYGPLFLLHLAQQKYKSARDYAKEARKVFKDREDIYIKALGLLSGYASKEEDYNKIVGYARVQEAFTNEKNPPDAQSRPSSK